MATLAKKLNIQKYGGGTVACNIYSTAAEAGSNYFPVQVDGVNGYVALGSTSDTRASAGRVTKSGTTYAILSTGVVPYTKKSYTTVGTHTFTVPSGITKLKVTVAGAGGGGGGSAYWCEDCGYNYKTNVATHTSVTGAGGAGGQGGLYTGTITVTPGTTYTITVGAGGSAGAGYSVHDTDTYGNGTAGGTGGKSSFGSLASASGGTGGGYGSTWLKSSGSGKNTTYSQASSNGSAGTAGTPTGSGATGGTGGTNGSAGTAGKAGWVYVEYGEGIS